MVKIAKDERNDSERNGTLSPKQESAALEMARGATYEQAAKTTGAGVTTIKLWAANVPAFNERVRELRAELTERVFAILAHGMTVGVRTLIKLTKSKSETMRHKAAESLLTHGSNAIELRQLRADVDELKRARGA